VKLIAALCRTGAMLPVKISSRLIVFEIHSRENKLYRNVDTHEKLKNKNKIFAKKKKKKKKKNKKKKKTKNKKKKKKQNI
jgi:fructose-specific phosphotransferase system component IIB